MIFMILFFILLAYTLYPYLPTRTPNRHLRLYLILNHDLKMSKGKALTQLAHALSHLYAHPTQMIASWQQHGEPKILLKAGAKRLAELHTALRGICAVHRVYDAGRTQIPQGSFTCLCVGPVRKETVEEHLGSLKMY